MENSLRRLDAGDPIARARELAPLLRECADEAEAQRRLPDRAAKAMSRAGLYRVAMPRSLGGAECEPSEQIEIIETIAAADGAAGWNLMIGIEVMGFSGAAFSRDIATSLFSDPEMILAGALNPVGVATPFPGGFRVTGRWPFASGCHNAKFFWGQCQVRDEGGEKPIPGVPALREALIASENFEIIDTWKVSGLRGSGSHDVEISDIFVPEEYMTAVMRSPLTETGTLFRLPPFSRLAYNKVGVSTGIARGAIEHFKALANTHTRRLSARPLRERPDVQHNVAMAETILRSARAFVLDAVGDLWKTVDTGDEPSKEQRALVHLACSNAAMGSIRAVDLVCEVAGTAGNMEGNPLERCQRDVRVIPQHITVSPQWNDAAGRTLLGMDSGSPFF